MRLFLARVDLGAMAILGYSVFPKAPALLEPHHQIFWCHIRDSRLGQSYSSTEMQLVYSTARADWAELTRALFYVLGRIFLLVNTKNRLFPLHCTWLVPAGFWSDAFFFNFIRTGVYILKAQEYLEYEQYLFQHCSIRLNLAQSAEAAEYTDWIFAEG